MDGADGPHDEHKFYTDSRGALVIPKGQSSFYSSMDLDNTTEERIVACRICHMNSEENVDDEQFDGIIVELGCNCKGELGAAHINCAETWFQIKGNTICEICGAIALNIGVEQEDEVNDAADVGEASTEELLGDIRYGRIAMAALVALCIISSLISYHLHSNDH
ncbi:hypothetical protein ACJIZ3_017890 [Penstemon smallii]|uniref:RING-CH-type domain-containing protein n=1 Tax=Penstemon smallii TaxID=265156 RepID=A0ABD3SXA0_9LAMI